MKERRPEWTPIEKRLWLGRGIHLQPVERHRELQEGGSTKKQK